MFKDCSQTLARGGAWCKKKYKIFLGPLQTSKNFRASFLQWKLQVNPIETHVNSTFTGKFVAFFSKHPPLQGSTVLKITFCIRAPKSVCEWSLAYKKAKRQIYVMFVSLSLVWVLVSGLRGGGGGGMAGGQSAPHPRDFRPGNFCWPTGKKEARKKGRGVKTEKKRREIVKGKVEKLQNEERTPPFFFFFFASHFSKPLKFVLGLPKWNFLPGKSISHLEKNQETWLCP